MHGCVVRYRSLDRRREAPGGLQVGRAERREATWRGGVGVRVGVGVGVGVGRFGVGLRRGLSAVLVYSEGFSK